MKQLFSIFFSLIIIIPSFTQDSTSVHEGLLILEKDSAVVVKGDVLLAQDSTNLDKEELSFFDFCIRDSITRFAFITDIKKLKKEKKESTYQPGKLVIYKNDVADTLDIKIRPRGNMRLKVCFFPPIKFKIASDELDSLNLDDIKSYKVVTHCKKSNQNEQWVLKELVAYKMYSTITDVSFRTHRITIDYVDENSGKTIDSKAGFIIESEKDLAKRLNGVMVERSKSHPRHNMPYYVSQMSMFQYMIGNTDWSFANLHNMKLIKLEQYQYTVPIAYDFDYSGMVQTEYATPDPKLPIDEVTDRLYRDVCQEEAIITEVIENFIEKKDAIFSCISEVKDLKKREANDIRYFVEGFYKVIENPKNMDRIFRARCDN